jgi:hypothetical protein
VFVKPGQIWLGDKIAVKSEQTLHTDREVKQAYLAVVCQRGVIVKGGECGRWTEVRTYEEHVDGPHNYYARQGESIRESGTFVLPVDAPPSSRGNQGNPRYKWYVEVLTQIADAPKYKARFPITVESHSSKL